MIGMMIGRLCGVDVVQFGSASDPGGFDHLIMVTFLVGVFELELEFGLLRKLTTTVAAAVTATGSGVGVSRVVCSGDVEFEFLSSLSLMELTITILMAILMTVLIIAVFIMVVLIVILILMLMLILMKIKIKIFIVNLMIMLLLPEEEAEFIGLFFLVAEGEGDPELNGVFRCGLVNLLDCYFWCSAWAGCFVGGVGRDLSMLFGRAWLWQQHGWRADA